MITLKQVEALYWIAELGSFDAAALRLSTTQSAISKRIQELENRFNVEIFDRSRRSAVLTPKGEEILRTARQLLDMRDGLLVQLGAKDTMFRRLRLGVTELTALTWLPVLVDRLRKQFPQLEIVPEVGLGQKLYERLVENTIDLVIVPDVFNDPRFTLVPVGMVNNAWMYADGVLPSRRVFPLTEITQHTLIVQGKDSGMGIAYGQWFRAHGIETPRTVVCSNLVAQIGLTVSGLGVSFLPKDCLTHLIDHGALRTARTTPTPPKIQYVAIYVRTHHVDFLGEVARICQDCCDFSRLVLQV
ncbi:LysR family transcriptional regulator [Paraburkholderia phosphatilytica]|uniref:LysR family transcriptional regulator n=1 Tax=Paraburkholderia phosphatilytica TaxID=2282883 RepID=UPI000E474B97|nr:LysR family transcriptional regulator [Paraburkholderia phosphatilytica]